jgi:hypothetical protein
MPGVDVFTEPYRISTTARTRFGGGSEILNQQPGACLTIGHATVSEHAEPAATIAAPSAMVAVMAAPDPEGASGGEPDHQPG